MTIRRGFARIEVIENGFLLHHDYPRATVTTFFSTLADLFGYLEKYVFCEVR